MNTKNRSKQAAVLLGAILLILCAASLLAILTPRKKVSGCIAEIYQEGVLLTSIPLDEVRETKTFLVAGPRGGENQVEIRQGSIGIVSADCPDKLCVRQGFLEAPGLPLVCLPHRLVIRLRQASPDQSQEEADMTTY